MKNIGHKGCPPMLKGRRIHVVTRGGYDSRVGNAVGWKGNVEGWTADDAQWELRGDHWDILEYFPI